MPIAELLGALAKEHDVRFHHVGAVGWIPYAYKMSRGFCVRHWRSDVFDVAVNIVVCSSHVPCHSVMMGRTTIEYFTPSTGKYEVFLSLPRPADQSRYGRVRSKNR